jgi:hypothetical protein
MEDIAGQIHHWHATSENHLALSSEPGNEIFAVDHHPTGQKFATSGHDCKVQRSSNQFPSPTLRLIVETKLGKTPSI